MNNQREQNSMQLTRSKAMCQSDTFRHLSPNDALTYNWIKKTTEANQSDSARQIAGQFNSVKEAVAVLLAESPSTSPRTLEVLAYNPSDAVRQAVADNPRTPVSALRVLVTDLSDEVRYAMAENHNLEQELLETLAEDDNPYVSQRAMDTLAGLKWAKN